MLPDSQDYFDALAFSGGFFRSATVLCPCDALGQIMRQPPAKSIDTPLKLQLGYQLLSEGDDIRQW